MKLGLLKCDPSPAHGGQGTGDGAAGWGVRDWWIQGCWCLWGCSGWRWGLFWDQAPSKCSPATNNALHRSVLQWVASCCNRKGSGCAEFVPLPLFLSEDVVSYSEKEVLAANASVHLQVPPHGLQGGPGLSLHPMSRLSSQRMQGGYRGRGYLIPKGKKVQRCE